MRNKTILPIVCTGLTVAASLIASPGTALGQGRLAVTVTNITNAQTLTPILVASHRQGVSLFDLGSPASSELATLAEEGAVAPLTDLLSANPDVLEVGNSGGLLPPGESVTVMVEARGNFDHLSVAAMLIPTNDAFVPVNGAPGPRDGRTSTFLSPAYEAGSGLRLV